MSDADNESQIVEKGPRKGMKLIPQKHGGALLPGQRSDEPSRNPRGRPAGGAVIEEWINALLDKKRLTPADLEHIARADDRPARRTAATQVLLSSFAGDISDYDPWIEGEVKNLSALKLRGVGTYGVKSCEVKRKRLVTGIGEDKQEWEVEHRKIELYDRSGPAFDRVMDRTTGGVRQRSQVDVNQHRTNVTIMIDGTAAPMPQLVDAGLGDAERAELDRLRARVAELEGMLAEQKGP